ncbi:hypothetical protein GCM10010185_60180 [Saccharothrix coeruleofusca]|uniref:Uncharacterized protein n=1 Tax=Saccharothrix coeruleofusca TaxID=33919 RepID=A0A918ASP9_9PSEU|nr:hypothetical protein GCM10010185_60180 [Saccharothrix coeruleofusca]
MTTRDTSASILLPPPYLPVLMVTDGESVAPPAGDPDRHDTLSAGPRGPPRARHSASAPAAARDAIQ